MESQHEPEEGRMERKKKGVRQRIVKVAIELFEHQGFDNTTMEQIAEAADVARKTLYNYFPVKEAIADEYVRNISLGLAQETFESLQRLPDTKSRLLAALNNAYGWVAVNPELADIVIRYRMNAIYKMPNSDCQKTGTQNVVTEIICQGQELGEIRPNLSVKKIVMYIDLLRCAMLLDWLKDTNESNLHDGVAMLVDFILYGVSDQPG